jgi:DNA mismatch repair protein MutL
MASIHVLPEGLVNQIAAGEVVERPASVVKELLENAVDAQASRIRLQVEEAGKKCIRVSDDGTGMTAADAALALASHATSKIAAAGDLEGITTLGFRGEALASIASVADVRLVTRTAEAVEATEVSVAGGKASEPRPTSGPVGTAIEVRNLFRYVPARRKFLKTDATEMGHITEAVTRIALAYPSVHLTVTHNGRSVYELPPSDGVRRRIGAFFGADLAEALLEVSSDEPAGRLTGLIGPPSVARATAGTQYLFLNGRYVRDRSLLHALREAYRGLLDGRRQPVAFLFLTVPPERVDVNVHPTKIEVRLRDQHLLYGQILSAVRERLLGPGITPDVAMGSTDAEPAETFGGETDEAAGERSGAREDRVRRAVADFLRSPPAQRQERLPLGGRTRAAGEAERAPPRGMNGTYRSRLERQAPQGAEDGDVGGETRTHRHEEEPGTRAVQLHNTYLVAESDDGILIVDQHALHERVLFEQMMDRLDAGPLASQRLLVPVTLSVSDREMAAVEQHREALAHLGIDVEAMGPRDVGIQAFPPLLERADPAGTLRDFLEWVLALESPPTPRQVLENLVHVAACRAAVKAGEPLQAAEIEALLAHRKAAEMASTCPHGRPAALMLRRKDLEKQFGRDYAAPARRADEESLPF